MSDWKYTLRFRRSLYSLRSLGMTCKELGARHTSAGQHYFAPMPVTPPPIASRVTHNLAIALFYAPPEVLRFLNPDVGRDYGIGVGEKLALIRALFRNSSRPQSYASFLEHLALVRGVFSLPRS